MYSTGPVAANVVPDAVIVTGNTITTPISAHGSLLVDPTDTTVTWVKTANFNGLQFTPSVLGAGVYTVTLRSSADGGFVDALGEPLDGLGNGTAGSNFVTTFVVSAPPVAVGVPSFARGPGNDVNLPNSANPTTVSTSNGIPVNLSNVAGVTSGTFTFQFNPTLLNITGATANTTAFPGSSMSVSVSNVNASLANAMITFASPTALSGTGHNLGSLTAAIPDGAASDYGAKGLLHWAGVSLNGGAINAVGDDAVQVVAWFGDANGDQVISGGDTALLARASGNLDNNSFTGVLTGFSAYPLVDPVIIGDVSSTNGAITSGDVTLMNSYLAGTTRPQIPAVNPHGLTVANGGPDPTLTIEGATHALSGQALVVPVNIDDAHPTGSTGMTGAELALHFDPRYYSVSPSDVHLGSLPLAGSGWTFTTVINSQTGDIGIDIYSSTATPIQSTAAGSLVTVTLHPVSANAALGNQALTFLTQTNPTGSRVYTTTVGDVRGSFVIHTLDGGAMQTTGETPSVGPQGIAPATSPTLTEPSLVIVEPVLEKHGAAPPVDPAANIPNESALPLTVVDKVFGNMTPGYAQESTAPPLVALLDSDVSGRATPSVLDQALQLQPPGQTGPDDTSDADVAAIHIASVKLRNFLPRRDNS